MIMADPITRLFSLGSKLKDLPEDKERAISGYGFYDWGKSAFETSVTVAFLPALSKLVLVKRKTHRAKNGFLSTLAAKPEISGSEESMTSPR